MENGDAMEMSKDKRCDTCNWYDVEYSVCCNGESEHRADFRVVDDSCEKYEEFNSRITDWKREAQTQAAAAGELKISIAEYLEELRVQKTALIRQLTLEDHDFDRVILQWKIKQLQQHIDRLEAILYGQSSTANH